ncbi:Lysophosphatidic acid:oleoyl-CoA acyltransferase 1 [Neophaeococcomyces mojaviensis]|uniref:Lysophosphatidic acid:oleoyl-CoA acyltransferase 1 n=1 Tax=Neophaeococcomyces mojaviensis TaxID=3383035 RepID=A0ACC2ZR63_9EURO|nr:Lysophosphatidic acid:oleoyl-CoA acyltransferase 1 [Knufia sp. JES_112]
MSPSENAQLIDLETLVARNPKRYVVVFPECTTSNGRGILPLSPSLLSASPRTKVFPVSVRYTAADITTPIPHTYFTFLWNLCSKPTHCIRTRIAEYVYNPGNRSSIARATALDPLDNSSEAETLVEQDESDVTPTRDEKAFLDKIAEALARLGRVKRVSLGVKEKQEFVAMWTKTKKR